MALSFLMKTNNVAPTIYYTLSEITVFAGDTSDII
jgi:hypothetical protein